MLIVQCPNPRCPRKTLRASPEHVNQRVHCRYCRARFVLSPEQVCESRRPPDDRGDSDVVCAADPPGAPLTWLGQAAVATTDYRGGGEADLPAAGALPARIGRFEVRALLGAGTFGTVYRAYDPQLDREVALKVPRLEKLDTPERLERFLREAKHAAQLRHPYIVPIYEAGSDGDTPYIAEAFIEGRTLAAACLAEGTLDLRRKVAIIHDLAEALAYAHGLGIVHRDVKPANVLLSSADTPHLADFGLAYRHGAGESAEDGLAPGPSGPEAQLTQYGTILGTPAYMAPEQASGRTADVQAASDQYSLGVVFYELLCGRLPFEGHLQILLSKHIHTPPPPRSIDPTVPLDLETICLKTLAKKPEDRYANCRELADDLRRWLEGEPIKVRRMGALERVGRWCRREPALAGACGIALAAILAGASLAVVFALAQHRLARNLDAQRQEAEAAKAEENKQRKQAEVQTEKANQARRQAVQAEQAAVQKERETEKARQQEEQQRRRAKEVGETLRVTLAQRERDLYFSRVALARQALVDGQLVRADQILQECPEERRQWEWVYLAHRCAELLRPAGQSEHASSITLSPNGRWLAWATDGTVLVRELIRTRRPLRFTCPHPSTTVRCLAFSADGLLLAAGCASGQVAVWDARTGKQRLSLKAHEKAVETVAFRPDDGKQLVSGGQDGVVKVWDVAGAAPPVVAFRGHHAAVRWAAFSPDGKQVASASADNQVLLWEAASGELQQTFTPFTAAAFSPKGQRVALAGDSGAVSVFKTSALRAPICVFRGHTGEVRLLAFDRDGKRVASWDKEGTLKVWEVDNGLEFPHVKSVCGFGFSGDGGRLAWVGEDRLVKLWYLGVRDPYGHEAYTLEGASAERSREQEALKDYSGYVNAVAVSRDGRLATASSVGARGGKQVVAGEVRLWALASGAQQRLWNEEEAVWCVAFSPDGQRLASAGKDRTIRVRDTRTGREMMRPLTGHRDGVNGLAFHPDGKRLASASDDGTVKLWDLERGQEVRTLRGHARPVVAVAFSPDGQRLASAGKDGGVNLWDVASGELVATLKKDGAAVNAVAFSPDGTLLASACDDGTVLVWRMSDGRLLFHLTGHHRRVHGVTFSPDGSRLASCGADRTVKLWETTTGREALSLQERCACFHLTFSADGQDLLGASAEGIKRWRAPLTLALLLQAIRDRFAEGIKRWRAPLTP